jgi:nucleotide-binding universal stress UspA family protein
MKIKSILARLQSAMGCQGLTEEMVLCSPTSSIPKQTKSTIDLVIAYNRSPSSQTALELTLRIADQTRLATQKQVRVHVVYVIDDARTSQSKDSLPSPWELKSLTPVQTQARQGATEAQPQVTTVEPCYFNAIFYQPEHLEQADQILWQARSLAYEWGGACNAHLRFGNLAQELKKVVESETAELLFLGCSSVRHPLVQQLGLDFPCPILGMPQALAAIDQK